LTIKTGSSFCHLANGGGKGETFSLLNIESTWQFFRDHFEIHQRALN
jgi:hypothetical protein